MEGEGEGEGAVQVPDCRADIDERARDLWAMCESES